MFNKESEEIKVKKYLVDYAKNTLDLEYKREKNIIKNCGTMITCNSILLVPFITIVFELYDRIEKARIIIIIFGIIMGLLIIFGLLFAILGQRLYKESYTKSAIDLLDYINNNKSNKNNCYFYDQTITDFDSIYKKKKNNNDKRKRLLFVSYILNYIFYALLVALIITILIII